MRWLPFALVLALIPAATAQVGITNPDDAAVTLHVHLMGIQDFPINTQPVEFDTWSGEPGAGLATHTFTCTGNPPPAGGQPFQSWHTTYGFSTASYVEYGFQEDGRPRIWPERQLGYDLTLDAGVPPVLHWYLETQTGIPPVGGVDPNVAPVAIPNVVVQATLRVGDSISVDDKAYDSGKLVAQGRSEPALLAADASEGVEHSMPDGRHVYGFRVPMELEDAAVGATGYTLRIDTYLDNPACADPGAGQTAMPNLVRPFADADHRPRITAGVLDPLRILSLEPRFNGTLVETRGVVQSVWGNYDVDEGNLTLAIEGPGGSFRVQPATTVQLHNVYGYHDVPVEIRWVWDRAGMPDGLYWLNLTASNDQHTANATATAAVHLGPDEAYPAEADAIPPAQEMPFPLMAPAVALVAAAALRSRSATVKRHNAP